MKGFPADRHATITGEAGAAADLAKQLMEAVSEDDRERAFRQLYELFAPKLRVFFLRRSCEAEECHDLTQETFLQLYRDVHTFAARSSFESWLFGIAVNVLRNARRYRAAGKRAGQEVELAAAPPAFSAEPSADSAILSREAFEHLRQELERLPIRMRRCFRLRFGGGLKYREIAHLMRIKPATAKSQVHQARQRLKERLAALR